MKIRQRYRPEKNATDALTKITQPLAKVASASTLLRPTRKLVVGPVVVGPVAHVLVRCCLRAARLGRPSAGGADRSGSESRSSCRWSVRRAENCGWRCRVTTCTPHFDLRREVLKPGDDQVLRPSHRPGSAAPTR